MRINQRMLIIAGLMFFLLLISYKFSLLHDTTQLSYLDAPIIPPFQRLITYIFMMIGIIPTILLMLYTSFFCHTVNPTGTVQTVCFNAPFSLGDSGGFFAYIVASIITVVVIMYIATIVTEKRRTTD
jgi:hypothetical protein